VGVFAGPDVSESGLVLALDAANSKSYPGSGTTWTDLSGNGNNGTLVNGVGYNSGNLGSLSFDGTNDYISFSSNPSLTNQITVETWVKLENPQGPNSSGWILGREGSYRMTYGSTQVDWVCATVNNGWYTTGTAISTFSISPFTQIYQFVATYDGSNNRIYVNGTLRTTGLSISGNIITNGNYYLIRSDAGNIDYGQGVIYSHKLYNRALTAQEIQQNFNATRSRFSI
jgi:hypothetical protein